MKHNTYIHLLAIAMLSVFTGICYTICPLLDDVDEDAK